VIVTASPSPQAVRTATSPPCACTTPCTIASPSPLPAPPPARKNRSKIRAASSRARPGPSSATHSRGTAAGTDYANEFSLPNTDSTRAYQLLEKAFPQAAGDTDTVVWKVDEGSVRDESVRSRIEPKLAEIAKMAGVGAVAGPYAPGGAAQISENGRIAYARVTFTEQANGVPKDTIENVVETARSAERDGLQVELGGQAIAKTQDPPAGIAETVGILAAAVVLFLAFGSFFAMLLPLVVAVAALGTGLMTIALLSHVTDVPEFAPLLGSLIGLGVGIDYALFIVTRHRRGILRGARPEDAAATALNTSGAPSCSPAAPCASRSPACW